MCAQIDLVSCIDKPGKLIELVEARFTSRYSQQLNCARDVVYDLPVRNDFQGPSQYVHKAIHFLGEGVIG